ncbi:hypothetical protein ACSBR2_027308 [Camellia fascicularis]
MIDWARDVGKKNGFVIIVKYSDSGGGRWTPRIKLTCERSGKYRQKKKVKFYSHDENARITGTKKCDCPFLPKDEKLSINNDWMLHVVCRVRNHLVVDHLEGYSYLGRLSHQENELLVDMSKSMVRPKDILVTLKQRKPSNVTTMKTIYNVRHRFKVKEKAGRSQMQQLLGKLAEHEYIEWHRCEQNAMHIAQRVSAYPEALDYVTQTWLKQYKEKFVASSTNSCMHYRNATTNRAESAHSSLKKQLESNQGTFETCWIKTKRAESIGIDSSACDWAIRHTHGLPCAHEITYYIRQLLPISLEAVHAYWRTLDIVKLPNKDKLELTCIPEVELVIKKFFF